LDEAVTWQSATIGIVAISGSRDYLQGQIEELSVPLAACSTNLVPSCKTLTGITSRADSTPQWLAAGRVRSGDST